MGRPSSTQIDNGISIQSGAETIKPSSDSEKSKGRFQKAPELSLSWRVTHLAHEPQQRVADVLDFLLAHVAVKR